MRAPRGGETFAWALAVGVSLAVIVSVPLDLLPWLRGPGPHEWQWDYRPEGPAGSLRTAVAVALAVLALLGVSFGALARRHPCGAARLLVASAVVLSLGLSLTLLNREPGGPWRALTARARSRIETSYLTVARSPEARDPLAFLRRHAELLPSLVSKAGHAATHPPGPVLYFRAAIALAESSPRLSEALLRRASVIEGDMPAPEARPVWAAGLLGALGVALMGALTAWPLARLGEALGLPPLAAARTALLWALLPGPALMSPQLDQAVALFVTAAAATLPGAARSTDWRSLVRRSAVAGTLGGVAFFLSYGAAAFLAVAGLGVLGATNPRIRRAAVCLAVAGVVTVAVAFGVPALLGHEPLRAISSALAIHRSVYTEPRGYALWLAFNLLDFALFLGPPVAVLAVARSAAGLAARRRRVPLDASLRFLLGVAAGLFGLLLLGATRGEVGRIWIPLMPLVLPGAVAEAVASSRTAPTFVLGVLLAATSLCFAAFLL